MLEFFFWSTYILLWLTVIMLVIAVFLLYRHHGRTLLNTREGRENQGPMLNKLLPNLEGTDLREGKIQFAQLRDVPCLIVFASVTCKPCQEIRLVLGTFAEKYQNIIQTFFICIGEWEEVAEFTENLPKVVQVIPDPKGNLLRDFRIASTPFALITNQDGVVLAKTTPAADEQAFEWYIEKLNISKEIETTI